MNANEPAYPSGAMIRGLSKLELIAAMAMQGILSNSWLNKAVDHTAKCERLSPADIVCAMSITHANALLAALEKDTTK